MGLTNFPRKPIPVFSLDIVLNIRDIGVFILLPIEFIYPAMLFFMNIITFLPLQLIPLKMVAQGEHATLDHNPCAHSQISNSCTASLSSAPTTLQIATTVSPQIPVPCAPIPPQTAPTIP